MAGPGRMERRAPEEIPAKQQRQALGMVPARTALDRAMRDVDRAVEDMRRTSRTVESYLHKSGPDAGSHAEDHAHGLRTARTRM